MNNLLTPQQIADLLGMSRIWVYKQIERGLLPFYRVGDCIRFDPEEIGVYLESRKGLKRAAHLAAKQEGVRKP